MQFSGVRGREKEGRESWRNEVVAHKEKPTMLLSTEDILSGFVFFFSPQGFISQNNSE